MQNFTGLNNEEVQERVKKFGLNELQTSESKKFFNICIQVIKEPMFILLLLCCFLYSLLGDLQEALLLSVFVLVIIVITLFQTWKTEKVLEALKDLSSPKTLVIREGKELFISSKELVPDDIMIVEEGNKISADALILDSTNLMVEESVLTGESISVRKNPCPPYHTKALLELGSDCQVYCGTLVTQGKAYTKVTGTGVNTKLGNISETLKSIRKEDSKFKKDCSNIISKILLIDLILCSFVIAVFYFIRHDLTNGLLTSITLAIAMLPEEIPAVLTIFMALGSWRISQKNVLTKNMSAIETLGSVTTLCVDKTGTITENKMKLTEIYVDGDSCTDFSSMIPEKFHTLLESAILASKKDSFDPIEQAIMQTVSQDLVDLEHLHEDWNLVHEYPLSKELFAMSRAWDLPDDVKEFAFYCKGSPEAIFDLSRLTKERITSLTKQLELMASKGLRVLGVAKSRTKLKTLPHTQHDIDFEFCGLIGFSDPVRPGVKGAIQDCYNAGIKVIIITGDYHVTTQNVANEIGLKNSDKYITGSDLDQLSDEELKKRIPDITIFSRVIPEQKLRIIRTLQASGQIIAMTGDGVNDAPALKASHVGIAMGRRGTDVAREAADLVLLDDNFTSIVSAIRLGRRIFDNLSKAMSYILSIHVPIAGLTLIPVIFSNLPVIFFPVHAAFLELILDPTCSIVFEAESEHPLIMHRPPQKVNDSILSYQRIIKSIFHGLVVLALVSLVYSWAIYNGFTEENVRCISFATLLCGNLALTFINKSWNYESVTSLVINNRILLFIVAVVVISFVAILNITSLRHLFYF